MEKLEGFVEKITQTTAIISLVDRTQISLDRRLLPDCVCIGDFITQNDIGHFYIDPDITEKRRCELRRMTDCYFG